MPKYSLIAKVQSQKINAPEQWAIVPLGIVATREITDPIESICVPPHAAWGDIATIGIVLADFLAKLPALHALSGDSVAHYTITVCEMRPVADHFHPFRRVYTVGDGVPLNGRPAIPAAKLASRIRAALPPNVELAKTALCSS